MKSHVRFIFFTLILVVIGTSLCFGQAAATRTKPQDRVKPTAEPTAVPATPAPAPAAADVVKFKPGLKYFMKNDGLQCLLDNAGALGAAYAEAAQSGCKKVAVGQATVYNCGYHPSAYYQKCLDAKAKIDAIFSKCGIKPPVHNPAPDGGWDMDPVTPGCNSLGITCIEDPA